MADAPDSGTPPGTAGTDPAQGGGTAAAPKEVGEQSGKPVDAKLAMAWKEKAEKVNEAEKRAREAEEREAETRRRLDEVQRATHGGSQPDPNAAYVNRLMQDASLGDPDAQEKLQLLRMQAETRAETLLTQALYASQVPPQHADAVADHVRRSGYQMTVRQALDIVMPPSVLEGQAKLRTIEEENAALRKQLEEAQRRPAGPGWSGSAPAHSADTPTMPLAEYRARIEAGGPEAMKLREQRDSGALRVDITKR